MQALYLAKACVSKGCNSDVVPGGIQITQIFARRQARRTSFVKCTLHASINRTGWYLSAYGARATPSCLMISQQRPELFHALFCRTRNTLAGARARNSSKTLALKICVLPITYCGSLVWMVLSSQIIATCVKQARRCCKVAFCLHFLYEDIKTFPLPPP